MTTLVIGARGSIGRHVLDQLLTAGEPVRAAARNPASADLPAAADLVAADLTRPDTLPAALDGVQKVFLYCLPGTIEAFITAAQNAAVEHVVLLSSGSVLLPYAVGNANAEQHRTIEHALTDSGLRTTPVRPLVLANNTLNWARSIRTGDTVPLIRPDAVTAPVHERDVAAVAVTALTRTGNTDDASISDTLTGPEPMTQRRQVELISHAIGRTIRVQELSDRQGREHLSQFMPPHIAAAIVELITAAAIHGNSPATQTAHQVLDRTPLSFAQWAHDHTADFR